MAPVPGIAAVATNLLSISPTSEPSDPDAHPAQFAHQLRQSPAGASTAGALRDFQDIEHGLRGGALDAVGPDLAAQSLQSQSPRIGVPCGHFGLPLFQLI